jgi:hypothetical protein
MPGPLYYYVNFHTIKLEDEFGRSKGQSTPWLRDIDWERAFLYEEARGFSGFEKDTKNSCHRWIGPDKEKMIKYGKVKEGDPLFNKNYISAREYLRMNHGKDLGKPLYENDAKNVLDMEARGGGKSYWASGMIVHNFIFDAAIDYDIYLEKKQSRKYLTSETLVGAIDAAYSKDLLEKVKLSMREFPGGLYYNEKEYLSPLSISYAGSLATGKFLTSRTGSLLHHRSFKDNPIAANGTRPNLTILEEVGFMDNIISSWEAIDQTQASAAKKTLVKWGLGTGGYAKAGAITYVEKVFRNPEEYNCLAFDDIWEGRGKICYFLPITKALNDYKEGPNMISNEKRALLEIEDKRKADKSVSNEKFMIEVINRPLYPSEMFMLNEGGFYNMFDLKERQAYLETHPKIMESSWKGKININEEGEYKWKNVVGAKVNNEFPISDNKSAFDTIEIWEHPIENAPYGTYLAGCDPYDDDESTTNSLGSLFIMNTLTGRIVAEYTARPLSKVFYENCRRLLMYYGALCNYEQDKKGMFAYFDQKRCTYLLAETPTILRDQELARISTVGNKAYGTHGTAPVNSWARRLLKDWSESQAYGKEESVNNIHTINSLGLLKEMIAYHKDINNADRISAMGMLLILREDFFKRLESQRQEESVKKATDDTWKKMIYKSGVGKRNAIMMTSTIKKNTMLDER